MTAPFIRKLRMSCVRGIGIAAILVIAVAGILAAPGHAGAGAAGAVAVNGAATPTDTIVSCPDGPVAAGRPSARTGGVGEMRVADHIQTCREVCTEQCGTNGVGDWICRTVCKEKCIGGSQGHGDPRKPSR